MSDDRTKDLRLNDEEVGKLYAFCPKETYDLLRRLVKYGALPDPPLLDEPPSSKTVAEIVRHTDLLLESGDEVAHLTPDEWRRIKEAIGAVGTTPAHCIDCIELKNALAAAVKVANEARECHDRDQDMRTMKLLIALSGHLPKWRADTDRIHDVLRRAVERLSAQMPSEEPAAGSAARIGAREQDIDVEGLTRRLLEDFSVLREAMAKDGVTIEMHLNVKGATGGEAIMTKEPISP